MSSLPPRLVALLERELSAARVYVASAGDAIDAGALTSALPRGLTLVVELADPSADRAASRDKLDALLETFRDSLFDSVAAIARPKPAEALHEALRELTTMAGAVDAVVIDATSSVTWSSASETGTAPRVQEAQADVIHLDAHLHKDVRRINPRAPRAPRSSVERVVERVRGLEATQSLPRGGALSVSARDASPPYVARSFATIYVLVLVFDAPFDELRVERALQSHMGVVERLVLALPPLEPTPTGGRSAIGRRR